ncbi:MAG: Secretion system C-terminal sorting domain, partial [Bacteroidota bacterium]
AASDTLSAGSPSTNAVYKMKQYSDEVQQYYNQYLQTTDCNQLVGVEGESEDAYGVNVYPNPSSDRVAVQTTRSSICKVELFNPVGSLVYSTSGLEVGAVIIDVNAYAKGLYSVRVFLKDDTVEVRKIIVE